jgi:hypothetical protein
MTLEQQIHAIEQFGYSEPEARFLRLVALHGGYFVRRQFLQSANCELGKRAQDFIEKVTGRKHACREIYREDRHLYRLHYKPIYAAIGEEDNRNRREHQPATIRVRLMALDFVQQHPEHHFLATEQDKLRYLFDTRKIDAGLLPSRAFCVKGVFFTRHFADELPMFLSGATSPEIAFCYIDDGQFSMAAFRSYLRQYHRLFQALAPLGLSFVTHHQQRFEAARKALRRFCDRLAESTRPSVDCNRLLAHFPHRLLWERRETKQLNKVQIDRLADDLHTFDGPRYTRLFELWQQDGDDGVRAELAAETEMQASLNISFTPCILELDYDLFGDLKAAS